MRYRVKDYKITISDGLVYVHIAIPDDDAFHVTNPVKEAIRLVVDETAKIVFCSSMQKDNIVSVIPSSEAGFFWAIGFAIPEDKTVTTNDKFTIEVDWGTSAEDLAKETTSQEIKQLILLEGIEQANEYAQRINEIIGDWDNE